MSEHDEQASLMRWAKLREDLYPDLGMLFAIPNGSYRHKKTAGMLKAEGVKAGIPDVFLAVARGPHHGLFGEMKFGKGRLKPHQREWLDHLEKQGYKTGVWHSWLEAARAICDYLGIYDEALQQ